MIDGPLSAPSSPPETPVPMNRSPLAFEVLGAPGRVGIVGVAAVDQDVARLEQRDELVDHVVDRRRRP